MKKPPFVIKGNFEGLFFTLQNAVLGASEEVPGKADYRVRIYEGKLTEPEFLDEYKPDNFANHDSMILKGADNITVYPNLQSPFDNENTFNFSQVVLINPTIIKTWNLNGKTYGRLRSDFLGITSKSEIDDGENKEKKDNNNNSNNNSDTNRTGTNDNGNGTNNDRSNDQNDNGFVRREENESNRDNSSQNQGCMSGFQGCLPRLGGCLKNIFNILLLLLFLAFLFWLLRSCSNTSIRNFNFCDELQKLEEDGKKLKSEIDDKRKKYKDELKKNAKLFSNIYFYADSDEIRNISEHSVQELIEFLKRHKSVNVRLEGHSNRLSKNNISFRRAQAVMKRLTDALIMENRVSAIGLENSKMLQDSSNISVENKNKSYNMNMRVEVILID